jgi:hypothetical protein
MVTLEPTHISRTGKSLAELQDGRRLRQGHNYSGATELVADLARQLDDLAFIQQRLRPQDGRPATGRRMIGDTEHLRQTLELMDIFDEIMTGMPTYLGPENLPGMEGEDDGLGEDDEDDDGET